MKIIKNIDEITGIRNPVVTIGSFDGVHRGHKAIIQRTIDLAKQSNGDSLVVTFSPHPQAFLHPEKKDFSILNTLEEKSFLLESLGINYLLIIPFNNAFANLSYEEFIRKYIAEKIKAKILVIGYDHHFGNNRKGTIVQLSQLGQEFHFTVEQVEAQFVEGTAVSSTKIRKALTSGDIDLANKFLDYPYSISGKIISGNGLGRTLGFPTANIEPDEKTKLLPADGAYVVTVLIEETLHGGMLNIGTRPTIGDSHRVMEVNIFNFSSDIYQKTIRVSFIERLRDETKFSTTIDLRKQLIKDKDSALKILSKKMS